MKALTVLSVTALCLSISTVFKVYLNLSELSFMGCLALSIFVILAVGFSSRVKTIGYKDWRIDLEEAKKVEASVKEVGAAIVEVFEAKSYSFMRNGYDAKKADEAMSALKKLVQ